MCSIPKRSSLTWVISLLLLAWAVPAHGEELGSATLVVKREKYSYGPKKYEVYLDLGDKNIVKIGDVDNNKTEVYVIPVSGPAKFKIHFKDIDRNISSEPIDFTAAPHYLVTIAIHGEKGGIHVGEPDIKEGTLVPKPRLIGITWEGEAETDKSSEKVTTDPGVKQQLKITRTLEHTAYVKDTRSVEGLAKTSLGYLEMQIRAEAAREWGTERKIVETYEQSVDLDGTTTPEVTLEWAVRVQRGTARWALGDKEYKTEIERKLNMSFKVKKKP
jgi:hypothetical protein